MPRAAEGSGDDAGEPVLCAEFAEAMDDDLGRRPRSPRCTRRVREGNTRWPTATTPRCAARSASVRAMLDVLGLDPLDPHLGDRRRRDDQLTRRVDALVARRC